MDYDIDFSRGVPLVRRARKPDEWSEDYLVDVVRQHGIRKPTANHLSAVRGFFSGTPHLELAETIINKTGGWRSDNGRPQYGSLPLPRWASVLSSVPIRYCPVCFVQDSYVRTRWRMSALRVCTSHGCYLKEGLRDSVLTWRRPGDMLIERDGATEETLFSRAMCCLPAERKIVSAIWGPFERAADTAAEPLVDNSLGKLVAWTLLAWRLVESVAVAQVKVVQRVESIGALPSVARLFGEFGLSISPDREGVSDFLLGLRHNVHFATAQRLLRTLIQAERSRTTVMGTLPLAELEEFCSAAAPRPGGRARPGEVAFSEEMAVGLSRIEAAKVLGASEQLVTQWMHIGWLPRVKTHVIGRKRLHFINRQDIQQLRRRLASLIYVPDLLSGHKIDLPTFYGLRAARLLDTVCVAERSYVTRQQLSSLICQLEQVSTPYPGNLLVDLPLFGQPTRGLCRMMETFGALVRTALSGKFPVYRDLERPGLAAFRFGQEGLAWLHNENRRAKVWARQSSRLHHAQTRQLELQEA